MGQKIVNIRMDEDLKTKFEHFCKATGMNISVGLIEKLNSSVKLNSAVQTKLHFEGTFSYTNGIYHV
ncbi:MAG: hypothetical protein LBM60_01465 [Clostridium sp.]|jgi:antitoxin component of RelBE/YafQ-DinJ toxin-antitoxin module|nr:hypothetical protein [Clostridium sp.]